MHKWLIENHYKTSPPPRTTELLAKMLMHKKIDAALANHYVMDTILEKQGLTNKVRTQVLKDKPLYVYFNNAFVEKYPDFLSSFNTLIPACRNK